MASGGLVSSWLGLWYSDGKGACKGFCGLAVGSVFGMVYHGIRWLINSVHTGNTKVLTMYYLLKT